MSVVLVTGATGNLGFVVADRLRTDGWQIATPVRDPDRAPPGAFARAVDLTDEDAVAAFARTVADELGPPTALVCCAGGYSPGSVADTPLAALQRTFDLNLGTAYTATRAVLPAMRAAGGGSIVYVGSRVVLRPFAGGVGPILSKAAVHALAEVVALEERKHGIRANAVLPRVIDTPDNRAAMPDADTSGWIPPARIADAVAWLVSDAGAVTTGALIPVDGPAS
jgi:NAD(P)-dependent dehydrogenase (short-subunit alcohol dehydrogenase family)